MASKPRYDSFIFGGHDMLEEYGIRGIVRDPLQPKLRPRTVQIPSRDGTYDFGAKYYENRTITIDCSSLIALNREQLRECSYVLAQKTALVVWTDPNRYYIGRIYNSAELRYIGMVGHEFVLEFLCDPFAYGDTVNIPVPLKFSYPATAHAPTLLRITNTGTTAVSGVHVTVREGK